MSEHDPLERAVEGLRQYGRQVPRAAARTRERVLAAVPERPGRRPVHWALVFGLLAFSVPAFAHFTGQLPGWTQAIAGWLRVERSRSPAKPQHRGADARAPALPVSTNTAFPSAGPQPSLDTAALEPRIVPSVATSAASALATPGAPAPPSKESITLPSSSAAAPPRVGGPPGRPGTVGRPQTAAALRAARAGTPRSVHSESSPAGSAQGEHPPRALYLTAHRLHFGGGTAQEALRAWDAFLHAAPRDTFAPEARYNRAIALIKLGRLEDALWALEPFACSARGSYRQREASELSARALARQPGLSVPPCMRGLP